MKTLITCSSQPPLYLSKPSPWKPRSPNLHPTTMLNLKRPTSKLKPHASGPKGFTGTAPATIEGSDTSKNSNKTNNNDDEEVPQAVFNRIIVRILAFVLVPMGLGLAFLHIFGVIKEQHLWDVPLWLPLLTTFLTFGASTFGIAYGALSTSWDEEKKGSILGLEEARENWVEMWKQEDI
ncbi:uncharacterized protein PAM68-like [Corylus avellana]|uniref:uncharacterized protein PAM68-like n=1 Tax=Corylus avellana TaxID=13451 RepID=UPI00286C4D97|nr:uncharacterized protein PAM68-like [Corylus avellana]